LTRETTCKTSLCIATKQNRKLNLGSEILGFDGDDDDFNGLGLGFGLLRDRNVLDNNLAIFLLNHYLIQKLKL
jgi:hypothetical protein